MRDFSLLATMRPLWTCSSGLGYSGVRDVTEQIYPYNSRAHGHSTQASTDIHGARNPRSPAALWPWDAFVGGPACKALHNQ